MIKLDSNNLSAIIGVCGSLFGVLLGFTLNQFLRLGKVKIFQNRIGYTLTEFDTGSAKYVETIGKDTIVNISMQLDFYNTSPLSTQIMRDIKLLVLTKNKSYFDIYQEIKGEKRMHVLTHLNLKPKQLISLKLSSSINNEMQVAFDSKWYFQFKQSNKRTRTIRLNKKLAQNNGL